MPSFQHDDVEIAYLDEGEGAPVVLVHGFASTKNVNWVYPTWVSDLRKGGRRVIALDTLKIAEGPKDVSRAARLAEAKGGQYRAYMKILGRGALLLATGAFELTLWVLSAVLALFGLLATIKSTTERATQAWLNHKRTRRLRAREMAAAAAAG